MSVRWQRTALPLSYGRWCTGRIRTCRARRHLIYNQTSLPLEDLCVVAAGDPAVARSCVGGRLTVRPPFASTHFKTGCRLLQRNLPCRKSWRELNARPLPSGGGALLH